MKARFSQDIGVDGIIADPILVPELVMIRSGFADAAGIPMQIKKMIRSGAIRFIIHSIYLLAVYQIFLSLNLKTR